MKVILKFITFGLLKSIDQHTTNLMKKYILSLMFLFFGFATFAQTAVDPCQAQQVVLYNSAKQKLQEGESIRGKVTLFVRNNPNCDRKYNFEIVEGKFYLVRGARPVYQAQFKGAVIDFSEVEKLYQPGDRILFELTDVIFTLDTGKEKYSSTRSVIKNWVFKN